MLELQIIYWSHFILPVLDNIWICVSGREWHEYSANWYTHVFYAHQAMGSPESLVSYTMCHSSSEALFWCSGPLQAAPAGSRLECLYHYFQKTAGERKGKMGFEKWNDTQDGRIWESHILLGELTQSAYPSWMVVHSLLSLLKARKYDVTKSLLQWHKGQF